MNNIKFAVDSPLDVDTSIQWLIVIPMETGFVNPIVDIRFLAKFAVPLESITKDELRAKTINDVYVAPSGDKRRKYVYAPFVPSENTESDFSAFYKRVFDTVGCENVILPGAECLSSRTSPDKAIEFSVKALSSIVKEYDSYNVIVECCDDKAMRIAESFVSK